MKAYGCTQTATNPDVFVPTIDSSILGITQTNKWRSLRLGVSGDIKTGRLQLGGDAALTYSRLTGTDAHWLRIGTDPGDFTGPIPEDGKGWGYQLEATARLPPHQCAEPHRRMLATGTCRRAATPISRTISWASRARRSA